MADYITGKKKNKRTMEKKADGKGGQKSIKIKMNKTYEMSSNYLSNTIQLLQ